MLGIDPHGNEIDYPEKKKGAARSVKDPIHDMIPISPQLSAFIDTYGVGPTETKVFFADQAHSKQFQRLRDIKQLGTSYFVWLGASHNRFEHCIGVAFLARAMASHLKTNQPELKITDRDIECVEIAGLCHDLGHGPWSHVWDGLFIPKALPDCSWKHEDASVMMFDALVEENPERINLSDEDKLFIKALIAGTPKSCPDEKSFLFDIVSNQRNGIDVDKFDYIPRDSHMIGDKMNIAVMRIINSARVLDNQICYDIKDANLIYEICATRFKLHKMVYSHKAAKAIEHMIIDALLAAEPFKKIAERVFQPDRYLYLTDQIMGEIEASTEPELAPSRAIFDRIRTRDLYQMVDYKVVDWPWVSIFQKGITPEKIVDAVKGSKDASVAKLVRNLKVDDVICDFSLMHYGMKEKNPLDFVKFYSKRHRDSSAFAERGVYSNLMPQFHAELLVRIYTKTADYFGIVQAGYRACLAALPTQLPEEVRSASASVQTGPVEGSVEPTPPLPDAPTTPRTFSRVNSFRDSADATFSNNSFTTVAPSFALPSPTRGGPRKRRRVDTGAEDTLIPACVRGG